MNAKYLCVVLLLLLGVASNPSRAQITFSEDFTGTTTTNQWYYFNGACLTAGSSSSSTQPGYIPGCGSVLASYYSLAQNADPAMVGGNSGYLGSTSPPSTPDPSGSGALRFTNGAPYGHSERGAILSSSTFPTGAGIQVTFKTVTYKGDSGGAGGDGADGISFFLMDGSKVPGLGAVGGSLAYSCSNNNPNYDGLNGAYIGLGIDEFGNFLNGAQLAAGYTGTNVATGDNAAYGYGYHPGRIGLRGAGSVSWPALTTAYGSNPSNSALPYYPASLATSCTNAGGVYSSATNNCIDICSTAGSTYDPATNVCNRACATGSTYDPTTNTCNNCTSVAGVYNPTTNLCTNTNKCLTGTTYYGGTATCDSCPASGYVGGTYANGQCTNSCPSGNTLSGTYCYPTGDAYSTGHYCTTGNSIASPSTGNYVCYPTGLSYNNAGGNYCPSGQTITGALCYPTGYSETGTNYCPSGQTIVGAVCYPTGLAAGSRNTTAYCATGQTITGASPYYCYPTGLSETGTNYCPSGQTITGTVCYPTGLAAVSRSATYYCPTGQSITGTSCYPTGDSFSGTNYCPSGQTISGTVCYPTGLAAASHSATYYCSTGYSITGTSCYPTGDSFAGTNYCPSGQTITGTSCYPTGSVYGAGYYCPTGDAAPTALAECCPSAHPYNSGTGKCSNGAAATAATAVTGATAMGPATPMSPATAMSGATAMPAATAMSVATAMPAAIAMPAATPAPAATVAPAAQTVTAAQTPTQITTPTANAPSTYTAGTGNTDALYSVQNTCRTGNLYNYSTPNAPTNAGAAVLPPGNTGNTAGILDYAPIAYKELTSFQIANEGATTRGAATPIFYNLKITQDGLLSFSYSVGGAYSALITNQSISASNGALPASFRVGFAGSTGGDTNVHEIMCFKAASAATSGSSATVNEKQAAKVEAGTQAYFALYNPTDWTGTVTANTLIDTAGIVTVSTTANWDASCVLSGTPSTGCASTGVGGAVGASPTPTNRVMLTWDTVGNAAIPFEWASLNSTQQGALIFGDSAILPTPPPTQSRLNYLRGDRSNEVNSAGVGLFRARDTILGDIVDSSPAWVGPPSSPYTANWQDRLYPTTVMQENSVSQSYLQFSNTEQTRLNVVYVGANDGFLHGFEAGSFSATGTFVANGTTPNDGKEVLAYMPGSTLASAATSTATGGCTNDSNTQTLVQEIHGVTPPIASNGECVEPVLDYSNTQYGHNFFVDATPGSGDLYYGGAWHSWLVSGLGAGGAAIFALDVTNPANFSETAPASTVMGEWNAGTITCANVSNCGLNLGNTFGTPQIRRLHNGNWGAIFGNGFGSQSGDAGIYVMSIDSSTGAATFYYLSTNTPGANGIAYVTPADLDGDHITDYVYAGDLKGNVWRFDLTSNMTSNWTAASTPLFTTQSGQPITTQLLVISSTVSGAPRLLIEFGTGQRTQLTNLSPVVYASGTQSLYGVWDWNMSAWNALSPSFTYLSLPATNLATGLTSPYILSSANLTAQTLTANTSTEISGAPPTVIDGTSNTICWQGGTTCGATGNTSYGWYVNLIEGNPTAVPGLAEQVIFNPVFYQGAFLVNTTVPANNLPTSCSNNQDSGYTYALNVGSGAIFTNTFPTFTQNGVVVTDSLEAGIETNATGSVYIVSTAEHTTNIIYQTISGTPGAQEVNIPSNTKAKRLTWVELR